MSLSEQIINNRIYKPSMNIRHHDHALIEKQTAEFLKKNKITIIPSGVSGEVIEKCNIYHANQERKLPPHHHRQRKKGAGE